MSIEKRMDEVETLGGRSLDIERTIKKQVRRRKMNYLERVLNIATQSDMEYSTNSEEEFAQLRENVQMFLINEMMEL